MDPEELAALEAAQAAAKAEADAAKAAADAAAAAAANKNTPSDAEARLLKDLMKHKADAKASKEALDQATARLKDFDGLDAAQLRGLLSQKAEAELKDAEKRGEYDRIIAQVRQDAEARVNAVAAEKEDFAKRLADSQKQIDELTIGSSFRGSKFVNEETVLTGEKARKLYGDHFEIEGGEIVAYDKPRGSSDRTPLVDPRSGSKLNFDDALEKIVKADSDFDRIAKSKLKPGAGSSSSTTEKPAGANKTASPFGRSLIAASLNARAKK